MSYYYKVESIIVNVLPDEIDKDYSVEERFTEEEIIKDFIINSNCSPFRDFLSNLYFQVHGNAANVLSDYNFTIDVQTFLDYLDKYEDSGIADWHRDEIESLRRVKHKKESTLDIWIETP